MINQELAHQIYKGASDTFYALMQVFIDSVLADTFESDRAEAMKPLIEIFAPTFKAEFQALIDQRLNAIASGGNINTYLQQLRDLQVAIWG